MSRAFVKEEYMGIANAAFQVFTAAFPRFVGLPG